MAMTEFGRRRRAARYALLDKIVELAPRQSRPADVLRLAEAYAWAVDPDNSHGGPALVLGDGDGDGDGGGGDGGDGGDGG
jgi:hypothetical protein